MKSFNFFGSYSSVSYLFDLFPSIFGVSMRQLPPSATKCIRVRRDSDDAEMDISFVNGFLNTLSLLAFVGSGSGYVVRWYNQGTGGSTYDAVQPTQVDQPRIVDSGVLETDPNTGLASPRFDLTRHLTINQLAVDFSGVLTDRSSFVVAKEDGDFDRIAFAMGNSSTNTPFVAFFRNVNSQTISIRDDSSSTVFLTGGGTDTDTKLLTSQLSSGTNSKILSRDGTAIDTSTSDTSGTYTLDRCAIGGLLRTNFTLGLTGNISEVIFRNEFSTLDRQGIDDNITAYYGI